MLGARQQKTETLGGNIGLLVMTGIVVNSIFVHLKIVCSWEQISASKLPQLQVKKRYLLY